MRRAMRVLLLAAGLLPPAPALAQTSAADKSAAETLFDEGRRLMSEGKFAEACPKFADSNRLDPGLGTLLNLGQCYKSLGYSASAWSTFREAAALARSSGQSDREALARSEASALEPSLVRLLIEVPAEVASANPQIRRDGTDVPQSLWGLATPVDPGVHVIEVSAAGKAAQRIEVSASTPGSTSNVTVPLLADDPNAGVATPPATAVAANAPAAAADLALPSRAAPSAPAGRSGLRMTGFVVGGIGVAAAAAGTVFLLLGKQQNDEALALCTGGPDGNRCANPIDVENHETHVRAARDNLRIGYVGVGVGALGVVSAVVLVALGSSSGSQPTSGDSPKSQRWALGPRVGGGELGIDVHAQF